MVCSSVLQMGQLGDACFGSSILYRYDSRRGDLFVLSWARVRRMSLERVSSVVFISGGSACSVLLISLLERYLVTMDECMVFALFCMSEVVTVSVFVFMFVVYLVLLNVVCFLSLWLRLCSVSVCSGCDGCCAFCLNCDACSCRCWWIGSMLVSSCKCCMFVSEVHPVAVLSAAFCILCNLSMLVWDAVGDHMVEAYSRTGLTMALYVARSVSFCFPHDVALNAFKICSDFFALFAVLSMCVL